jgi:hypothetical protein
MMINNDKNKPRAGKPSGQQLKPKEETKFQTFQVLGQQQIQAASPLISKSKVL